MRDRPRHRLRAAPPRQDRTSQPACRLNDTLMSCIDSVKARKVHPFSILAQSLRAMQRGRQVGDMASFQLVSRGRRLLRRGLRKLVLEVPLPLGPVGRASQRRRRFLPHRRMRHSKRRVPLDQPGHHGLPHGLCNGHRIPNRGTWWRRGGCHWFRMRRRRLLWRRMRHVRPGASGARLRALDIASTFEITRAFSLVTKGRIELQHFQPFVFW